MTVEIVEVVRRSEQGMTRPFICRDTDGDVWFVKGIGAGRRSQLCEWIAGMLGLALELPIPRFEIVDVPEALIDADIGSEVWELGAGRAFGSRREEAMELTASAALAVPEAVQRDLLVFDWWICNGDRLLTENGGNPNVFWNPSSLQAFVIDHNLAFDPDFDAEQFLYSHVFCAQRNNVFGDMLRRDEYNNRFASILDGWPDICATLPQEWFFLDAEETIAVDFDLNWVFELLKRHELDEFWDIP